MLETKRLILRKWNKEDIEPFMKINQDPKVIEYLLGPMDLTQAENFINGANEFIDKHGFGLFAACLKDRGELIGFIGLNIPNFEADFTPCVEVGWRLGSQYWGNGYAPEGAKACLEYGFKELKLDKILSWTAEGNKKSIRVMEKLGMKYEKDFSHPKLDIYHPLSKHVLYYFPFLNDTYNFCEIRLCSPI